MLNFAGKVFNLLNRSLGKSIGIDLITGQRFSFRDDIEVIGTEYGGWAVPVSALGRDAICYCAGCGEDISFDLGLIARFGCQVYAFDPTPRAVKYVWQAAGHEPRYHFSELGLWDSRARMKFFAPRDPRHVSHSLLNLQQTSDYFEADVMRLSDIMRRNGHWRIDLLKLDIEGAEYKVIDSIAEDGLDIGIICVEFDELSAPLDGHYRRRIKRAAGQLVELGYSLAHIRQNSNYTFFKLQNRIVDASKNRGGYQ